MKKTILFISLLILLCSFAVNTKAIQFIEDSFNDNSLNTDLWNLTTWSGGGGIITPTETNYGLRYNATGDLRAGLSNAYLMQVGDIWNLEWNQTITASVVDTVIILGTGINPDGTNIQSFLGSWGGSPAWNYPMDSAGDPLPVGKYNLTVKRNSTGYWAKMSGTGIADIKYKRDKSSASGDKWIGFSIIFGGGQTGDIYIKKVSYCSNESCEGAILEKPTPLDNTANNTQVMINVSCSSDNVYLYFDNQTNPNTLVITNQTSPANYTTSVTGQVDYYFKASCGLNGANTTIRTWNYDTTTPNITILQNLTSKQLKINLSQYIEVYDNNSGLRSCLANFTFNSTNESKTGSCTSEITLTTEGSYDFRIISYDNANNLFTYNSTFIANTLSYVYFFDNKTALPLTASKVDITYPDSSSLTKYTNNAGAVNFSANGIYGNYTITFTDKTGYVTPISFTEEINVSNSPINKSYSINRAKITINIYDRETKERINANVSVQIPTLLNTTTNNGSVILNNVSIVAGEYGVYTQSDNYYTEKKTITYTSQNLVEVDLYLVNKTSTDIGNLIVQVYDDFYNYIIGANVKLLEFDAVTNSFIEIAQSNSDSNGESIFQVELGTKFYIATATFTTATNVLSTQSTTTGQIIALTNTVIELHFKEAEAFIPNDLFDFSITPYNTSLIGNLSILSARFDDPANLNHKVCIGYFTQNGLNEINQSETCITGSAGYISATGGYLLDRSFSWIAKIYVIGEGGEKIIYKSYPYNALEGTLLTEFEEYLVKPILFAIILILLALSLYLKNIKIFGIGIIPFAPISLRFYPDLIGGVTMTFIILLGISILYLTNKKREI